MLHQALKTLGYYTGLAIYYLAWILSLPLFALTYCQYTRIPYTPITFLITATTGFILVCIGELYTENPKT